MINNKETNFIQKNNSKNSENNDFLNQEIFFESSDFLCSNFGNFENFSQKNNNFISTRNSIQKNIIENTCNYPDYKNDLVDILLDLIEEKRKNNFLKKQYFSLENLLKNTILEKKINRNSNEINIWYINEKDKRIRCNLNSLFMKEENNLNENDSSEINQNKKLKNKKNKGKNENNTEYKKNKIEYNEENKNDLVNINNLSNLQKIKTNIENKNTTSNNLKNIDIVNNQNSTINYFSTSSNIDFFTGFNKNNKTDIKSKNPKKRNIK